MDAAVVTQITESVSQNLATAGSLITTAGLALVGFAALGFIFRKVKAAASGRV